MRSPSSSCPNGRERAVKTRKMLERLSYSYDAKNLKPFHQSWKVCQHSRGSLWRGFANQFCAAQDVTLIRQGNNIHHGGCVDCKLASYEAIYQTKGVPAKTLADSALLNQAATVSGPEYFDQRKVFAGAFSAIPGPVATARTTLRHSTIAVAEKMHHHRSQTAKLTLQFQTNMCFQKLHTLNHFRTYFPR